MARYLREKIMLLKAAVIAEPKEKKVRTWTIGNVSIIPTPMVTLKVSADVLDMVSREFDMVENVTPLKNADITIPSRLPTSLFDYM